SIFPNLEILRYGQSSKADLQIENIKSDFNGTTFTLRMQGRQMRVKIPLIGVFNVYNAVAAIAAAKGLGFNIRETISLMEDCPQVPGRLEAVGGRQMNYRVFVDYAHTPDALENVIRTLRDLQPNRLITVFGCGGDRDRAKRRLMAEAAEAGSDYSILTSDNPRTEDPEQILDDAQSGLKTNRFERISDRKDAIFRAVELAGEKDIVLIAGKGHENYQEIHGVREPFDDRDMARKAIARKAESDQFS
ncbi:MAG: UDP-N-acetylmuramyl-tripeptide synthetase, partial [Verrucomicrobiota bacterium]